MLSIPKALEKLKNSINLPDHQNVLLYNAGIKFTKERDYSRIFPRDALTSAFLFKDLSFLRNMLIFSAATMGHKIDAFTGEEPGKVVHEYPGMIWRDGLNTQYSAVDTSILFLVGIYEYWYHSQDLAFVTQMHDQILRALEYIQTHVQNNLFWDDPRYYNATHSAALSGCWRDSGYAERDWGRHAYPASYLTVNLLLVKALRGLSVLQTQLGIKENLATLAESIKSAVIEVFYLPQHGYFASAVDQQGAIETLYLDSIWSFYFLEEGDLSSDQIDSLFKNLERLLTPYGYLSRDKQPPAPHFEDRLFLGNLVWPFEQAYLGLFALKHKRHDGYENCTKGADYLTMSGHPFSEYIIIDLNNSQPKPGGCDIQLWTVAYQQMLPHLNKL